MAACEAIREAAGSVGVLRGEGVVVAEHAAALEVGELSREVPGLHAMTAGSKAGPTGLHLDG